MDGRTELVTERDSAQTDFSPAELRDENTSRVLDEVVQQMRSRNRQKKKASI